MILPEMYSAGEVGLKLFYISKSVEVQREMDAFPFGSLVADVGGVLGLFIGFNFLMVWDWSVWAIKKIFVEKFKFCKC